MRAKYGHYNIKSGHDTELGAVDYLDWYVDDAVLLTRKIYEYAKQDAGRKARLTGKVENHSRVKFSHIIRRKNVMSPQLATILSAIISGAVAVIICIINNNTSQKNMQNELKQMLMDFKADTEKNRAVTDERINNLAEEVRKHNSLVERTFKLEAENDVQDEKIAEIEKRLDK